jgi:hypothetical protein
MRTVHYIYVTLEYWLIRDRLCAQNISKNGIRYRSVYSIIQEFFRKGVCEKVEKEQIAHCVRLRNRSMRDDYIIQNIMTDGYG